MNRPSKSGPEADERFAETAALYAAGALTPEECVEFERRLKDGCRVSREAWSEMAPVVDALGSAIPPQSPSPQVRANLLARIESQARHDA